MKRLRKKFKSRGFEHEEVVREGRNAIYKRWDGGKTPDAGHIHYEVVKIGKHNGYNLGGSYIEPAETYPSTSMWGVAGWTCSNITAAQARFNDLNKYE